MSEATISMPTEDQVVELKELRRKSSKSWHAWKEHQEESKKHKADWEATNLKIGELIDEIDNPTPHLPFQKDAQSKALDAQAEAPVLPEGDVPLKFDPDTDLRWREVPITELRLSDKITESLEHANIWNMGHLVDYQKDGACLTTIKGIGPAANEKISEATIAFWASASDRFPPIAQAAPEATDAPTDEELADRSDDDFDSSIDDSDLRDDTEDEGEDEAAA